MTTNRHRTGPRAMPAALGCLALLTPLILCGCAPQPQWTRPEITQTEFDRDAAACRREASRATYRDPFAYSSGLDQGLEHAVAQERFFEQCMFSRGYRQEERPAGR
ncbi:MAG: hypothetical protein LBD10_12970 [Desulfobulbus sp.]|uniref:hypothetical protein n=1 Tax=Desulfobulbus sp. TaxID=895 RepID=UPI002843394C|nr:hypothetical protein [Desulfobulbus sp.]MDR2551101.1 hypothetical protein [Desulfobulbus sp.]